MCQPELGPGGCSQVARACHAGAADPQGEPVSDATENAVDVRVPPLVEAKVVDPGDLKRVCTPLRSTTGLCPAPATGLSAQGCETGICKRPRLQSLLHASFPSVPPSHVDRLQKLYPHTRDKDCYLDDKEHKYFVHGRTYSLSVSGWWKKYFEEFDPKRVSENIVRRHLENSGFCANSSGETTEGILLSSVYNLAQHIRVFEKRDDTAFLNCLHKVATVAQADYAHRGAQLPFSVEHILEVGQQLLADMRKPASRSCYYLMLLHTTSCGAEAQAAQMARTWEVHGNLESLKGTYLHKKVELFINAMARPMETSGSSHVPVGELLRETIPAHEYCAATVMQHIAWAQEAELWDHPLAQSFLQRELWGESLEFAKFRSWLSTKPLWTPLRVEWSLYNEDLKVCGQVDSLWFDLESNGAVVMADWKRARALLTSDEEELMRQSFGKRGNFCCSHLYDAAWSHYLVQQSLYAYMLDAKYGVHVQRMMLVQCHPQVCGSDFNEAPLVPDFELADAMAKALMCESLS